VIDENTLETSKLAQLESNGLPSMVTYAKPTITVSSQANTQGQYKLYLVAEISDFWQVPPVSSALPITINVIAPLPNKPPILKDPLPSFSLKTGKSESFPVPVSSAIDPEGDSITAKVILPESFMTWDSAAQVINIDGEKALEKQA